MMLTLIEGRGHAARNTLLERVATSAAPRPQGSGERPCLGHGRDAGAQGNAPREPGGRHEAVEVS